MSPRNESTHAGVVSRFRAFARKSSQEQVRSIYFRLQTLRIPMPVRLAHGAWWLARDDFLGVALFSGGFENAERLFVGKFLRSGMTVLDIGAHHGYYTLLASKRVGSQGRVLAVEPSPRERKRLRLHLVINVCTNVRIESCALGEAVGTAELHVVKEGETGCNSLRRPAVTGATERIPVRVERLDQVLQSRRVERVDFVKLDVEGAELSVLRGASELLHTRPRPVILAEVYDIRTMPWGYRAYEIVRCLSGIGYLWFALLPDGSLEPIDALREHYDGNFVAVPPERMRSLESMINDGQHPAAHRRR